MKPYSGIWPVVPTIFNDDGSLDLEGQERVLDCMIAQGVDGVCILANFSEQFLISDAERETLTRVCVEHIRGRVPVIVTISHFASIIAIERARQARIIGADIVMMMPPYHGALLKGTLDQTREQFAQVGDEGIPIMLQDAPLSGVELPVDLLATMAQEIEMLKLFKIECPGTAAKLRSLLDAAGDYVEGPFDGEEGITLLADLDAGASGSMTSALIPDQIKPVITSHLDGDRESATKAYARVLPTINFENRQCGFRACKEAMVEGRVIKSAFCRHPIPPLSPVTKAQLMEHIKELNPMILRWAS